MNPSLLSRAAALLSRLDSAWGQSATAPVRPVGTETVGGWANPFSGFGFAAVNAAANTVCAPPRSFSRQECTAIYQADGLAARCVNLPIDAMLRRGWSLSAPKGQDGDEVDNDAWQAWAERLPIGGGETGLEQALARWLKWADIYGGAAIFLVCGDTNDPARPLHPSAPLLALRVLSRFDLAPVAVHMPDPLDGDGIHLWRVNGTAHAIHRSRLLFLGRAALPAYDAHTGSSWGWTPPVWAQLERHLQGMATMDASTVKLVDSFSVPIRRIRGLAASIADGASEILGMAGFRALMRSVHREEVADLDNEEIANLSHNVTGLEGLLNAAPERIAGVTGIPLTILMGRPPAGMTSDDASARRVFYDLVSARQEKELRSPLRTLYTLAANAPAAPALPPRFQIDFASLYQPDDTERAAIATQTGQSLALAVNLGALPASRVTVSVVEGVAEWGIKAEEEQAAPAPRLEVV